MKHSAINEYLGIKEDDSDPNFSRLTLQVREEFANEGGITHGGIVALLVDGAMGRTVLRSIPPEFTAATVQLSIQYLRQATGKIQATAKISKLGTRMIYVEGECRDQDDRVVAMAHGTWAVLPSPSPELGGEKRG